MWHDYHIYHSQPEGNSWLSVRVTTILYTCQWLLSRTKRDDRHLTVHYSPDSEVLTIHWSNYLISMKRLLFFLWEYWSNLAMFVLCYVQKKCFTPYKKCLWIFWQKFFVQYRAWQTFLVLDYFLTMVLTIVKLELMLTLLLIEVTLDMYVVKL